MSKRCFKCGDEKPLEAFYAHPMMADGRLNKCADCAKKDARNHRLTNADKVREYDRTRARLPHRKAQRDRLHAEEWDKNPERVKARAAVSREMRAGRLVQQPCAFCGATDDLEAHHHDYGKPLDVTWLCRPCHRRFHALERMATYRESEAA